MYLALAILMLAAISCGSPEPVEPTPTPDVPLFAEGEAVALVEAKINAAIRAEGGYNCSDELITAWVGVLYQTTTASSYLGGHIWLVTSDPFEYKNSTTSRLLSWKVYEYSLLVQPTNVDTQIAMKC